MYNNKRKKMIKKTIFISALLNISLIIVIIFFLMIPVNYNSMIYTNWEIRIPKYKKIYEIFKFNYREGQDFVILEYEKIENLINSEEFKKVSKDNVEELKNIVNNYYNSLDVEEKKKFDDNIDVNYLYNEENYFLFKNEPSRYIVIIACKNNKAYILSSVE